MEKGRKHHYIPVFYLTHWCGPGGRLCQYSRPYDKVVAKPKYPTETGFERGLYTLRAHTSAVAEIVEDKLMGRTDHDASRALRLLLDNNIGGLDEATRSGWARFIISLLRRTPESLRGLGNTLETLKQLQALSADEFINRMNHKMACQARKFVYGLDDSHLSFVSERLGRMESAAPGDAA
jgi:hypothetical protein